MSAYYIRATLPSGEDVFYFLDSTSQVKASFPAKLSQNPLANGQTAADNYVIDPVTLTYSGRITDIKSANPAEGTKTTKQYIDGLNNIRRSGRPVAALYHVGRPEAENCFFVTLETTQDSVNGYIGTSSEDGQTVNSYKINFTLQQALYARGAQVAAVPATEFSSSFQEKVKSSATTQQAAGEVSDLIVSGETNKWLAQYAGERARSGVSQ